MSMARPSVARTPFAQRLTSVRLALGHKDRKPFADFIGMNAETLGGYERGDSLPDHDFLARYKHDFSVNLDWLITGEGEMFSRPASANAALATLQADDDARRSMWAAASGLPKAVIHPLLPADQAPMLDFVYLPAFDGVRASAGTGTVPTSEQIGSLVAFDRKFLRDHGANPEQCSIISASGDSMHPSIPDGSLLVVDHSQAEVRNGHIMVINVGEDLLVKRIRRRLDGLIDLISDNAAYPPETLGPDRLQQLRVVGRVVYFCRVP